MQVGLYCGYSRESEESRRRKKRQTHASGRATGVYSAPQVASCFGKLLSDFSPIYGIVYGFQFWHFFYGLPLPHAPCPRRSPIPTHRRKAVVYHRPSHPSALGLHDTLSPDLPPCLLHTPSTTPIIPYHHPIPIYIYNDGLVLKHLLALAGRMNSSQGRGFSREEARGGGGGDNPDCNIWNTPEWNFWNIYFNSESLECFTNLFPENIPHSTCITVAWSKPTHSELLRKISKGRCPPMHGGRGEIKAIKIRVSRFHLYYSAFFVSHKTKRFSSFSDVFESKKINKILRRLRRHREKGCAAKKPYFPLHLREWIVHFHAIFFKQSFLSWIYLSSSYPNGGQWGGSNRKLMYPLPNMKFCRLELLRNVSRDGWHVSVLCRHICWNVQKKNKNF